jgi:hypothetical protein
MLQINTIINNFKSYIMEKQNVELLFNLHEIKRIATAQFTHQIACGSLFYALDKLIVNNKSATIDELTNVRSKINMLDFATLDEKRRIDAMHTCINVNIKLLDDAPVDDAPVDDAPVDDAPVDDAPVDDAPIDDAPVDDAQAAYDMIPSNGKLVDISTNKDADTSTNKDADTSANKDADNFEIDITDVSGKIRATCNFLVEYLGINYSQAREKLNQLPLRISINANDLAKLHKTGCEIKTVDVNIN